MVNVGGNGAPEHMERIDVSRQALRDKLCPKRLSPAQEEVILSQEEVMLAQKRCRIFYQYFYKVFQPNFQFHTV